MIRLTILLLLAGTAGLAHGAALYDSDCCGGGPQGDCFSEGVTGEPIRLGYRIRYGDQQWIFAEAQTRQSRDGRYHICLPSGENGERGANPRCVYVPTSGT